MHRSREVFETWLSETKPIMPVVVIDNREAAVPLANTLIKGGVRLVEVTLRTPSALAIIETLAEQCPDMIVGAGTVINVDQVCKVSEAGGRFIVSPGFSGTIADQAEKLGIAYLPGVATATEIMMALERGYSFLKFFPAAQAGGIDMLKALSGPFPQVKFCPTGGVSKDNYKRYLAQENVLCAGGSWVASPQSIRENAWEEVFREADQL